MSGCLARKRAPTGILTAACLFLVMLPGSLLAQGEEEYPKFSFDGHFRLRGEADGRTAGSKPDYGVLSRVRLGVRADLLDWLDVYAQIQDARLWGTETNTLTDAGADNFDMHQIYADLGRMDEAREQIQILLTKKPDAKIQDLTRILKFQDTRRIDWYVNLLQSAGLPE